MCLGLDIAGVETFSSGSETGCATFRSCRFGQADWVWSFRSSRFRHRTFRSGRFGLGTFRSRHFCT